MANGFIMPGKIISGSGALESGGESSFRRWEAAL